MSRSVTDERLCFIVDYDDTLAGIARKYQLLFFLQDSTVELTDIRNRRLFLKRTTCPTLTQEMLFMGASIVVFSKVLRVVEYGDDVTRQLCEALNEPAMIVIGSEGFDHLGKLLTCIQRECTFTVRDMSSINIKPSELEAAGVSALSSPVLVMTVVRQQASKKAQSLLQRFPPSLLWASTSRDEFNRSKGLMQRAQRVPSFTAVPDSSLCIVKPHALSKGNGGEIVQCILDAGLVIEAIAQFHLNNHEADDFLEPYKGVLEEYGDMVTHIASSQCWAIQVRCDKAVKRLRELCGPFDPVVAKHIRPGTLRAKYGEDKVRNAVHCTDLEMDGLSDVEFFFQSIVAAHY